MKQSLSNQDGSVHREQDESSQSICLAYLDRLKEHGNIKAISTQGETPSSRSNIFTGSKVISRKSLKETEQETTGSIRTASSTKKSKSPPVRDWDGRACPLHLQKPEFPMCPRDAGEVCQRILNVRISQDKSENIEPLREPKKSRVYERSAAPGVERSEAEGASGAISHRDRGADVGRSPADGAEIETEKHITPDRSPPFSEPSPPIESGVGDVERSEAEPTKDETCHARSESVAGFLRNFDFSEPVPERKTSGPPFLIDERAVKERLTWDQVKHRITSYCYQTTVSDEGHRQAVSRRRRAFESGAVLLTILLSLRPGELRTIRWRDLKTHYVEIPSWRLGKVSYGTLTAVVIEVLKSWRTDAELDSDFVFRITERTFERISHRILGADTTPKDLRRFHVKDCSVEEMPLVRTLRMLKPSYGLRSGELLQFNEEKHTYNTALEHGFAHPDAKKTRQMKYLRMSGWRGKGVDH